MVSPVVRRMTLTPDDQAESRYFEVPFDISSATSLEVTLSYDSTSAVIDLGCRDPERWRGWSGGARSRFMIATEAATPGYEPGDLPNGQWAVVLGLHKIPAGGVEVELTISVPATGAVEADPAAPPAPDGARGSARNLPALDGLTWFAGDFHAHTLHSDGDHSIAQLAAAAAGRGLDFLAVTDHNTVSHHPHLAGAGAAYNIALLPGQEVTSARGHANAFGDIGWIDFRKPAVDWMTDVADRGGILSINHPIEGEWAWQHSLAELPPALEFWHIGWFRDLTATAMWALWPRWRQDAILLGGSDFHDTTHGYPPGTPTTWVAAEDRSPEAILAGVAAGRTAITRFPIPSEPTLVRVGEDLVAVDADGAVLVDIRGAARMVRGDLQRFGDVADGPYRLQSADGSLLAISR